MEFGGRKNLQLVPSVFKIAARGGFRLGSIVLIISLFTGLIVTLEISSSSYTSQAATLEAISIKPTLSVHGILYARGIRVDLAAVTLDGRPVVISAPSDIRRYLQLNQASFEGQLPGRGEALLGARLKILMEDSIIRVEDHALRVVGFVSSPTQLSYTMIVDPKTLEDMGLHGDTYYFSEADANPEEPAPVQAPSLASVVGAVTQEALRIVSFIWYVLLAALVLTCLVQGYNLGHVSRKELRIFSALNVPRAGILASLSILSFVASGVAVLLGYGIGVATSAVVSYGLSNGLNLPYARPVVGVLLLEWLAVAFVMSFLALTIGAARAWSNVDSN